VSIYQLVFENISYSAEEQDGRSAKKISQNGAGGGPGIDRQNRRLRHFAISFLRVCHSSAEYDIFSRLIDEYSRMIVKCA
jgi:hypothetical protein